MKKLEKGLVITIEGANGSGKETQTRLLQERLQQRGYGVKVFHYPEYDSATGELLKKYLAGELGEKEDLLELSCLLFAADRLKNKPVYSQWLSAGGIILNDRYQESNWAIQGALIKDLDKRRELIGWMQTLEVGMPASDIVLYLQVPPEVSWGLLQRRAQERGERLDEHEADKDFLVATHRQYKELSSRYSHWNVVNCAPNNKLLSITQIQELVWGEINESLAI